MANWGQLTFQDPATPTMILMYYFHGHAIFIISWVVLAVSSFIIILMKNKHMYTPVDMEAQSLEIMWTILPSVLIMLLALPSLRILYVIEEMEQPALTLKATGNQWYWSYEYTTLKDKEISFHSYMIPETDLKPGDYRLLEVDNRLVLPTHTNIRVLITSEDVIHSWAIPSMGVKMDAVPGRLNQIYLNILRPGIFYGQCSEICGANHSFMPIALEAIKTSDFILWMTSKAQEK